MSWRGAGVVDRGALEKHCGGNVTVGSNPTLSAKVHALGMHFFHGDTDSTD